MRSVLAVTLLGIAGVLYCATYYNYGFDWADEGSVSLIAEKLARGETPYIDVEIGGYGVLWYYPIALLFDLFGAHFDLVRIWFAALGVAAALCSYALLLRLTRNWYLALAVGLLVLVFPGSSYKTYIPLLVVSGGWVIFLYRPGEPQEPSRSWVPPLANGIYFALAFLIRGDIATGCFLVFLVYHACLAWEAAVRERNPRRWLDFPGRVGAVLLVFVLASVPFAAHAVAEGYLDRYLRQYSQSLVELVLKTQSRLSPGSGAGDAAGGTLLPRVGLLSFGSGRGFIILTYGPLLVLFSVWLFLAVDFFRRGMSRVRFAEFLSERIHLIALSIVAFTAFPQFFVFRPDLAHLSEFLPGMVALCAYFLYVLSTARHLSRLYAATARTGLYLFGAFCLGYAYIYADYYQEGYALRAGRDQRLRIGERIDVYANARERLLLGEVYALVSKESAPEDFVLCFSYCPGLVFATGRPTFQKDLYVDNSILIARPGWVGEMKAQIAARQPKVVIISNANLNRDDMSRFPRWAAPIYQYVRENYELKARLAPEARDERLWFEVYVRK